MNKIIIKRHIFKKDLINIKPTTIRSVINAEKEGYGPNLLSRHGTFSNSSELTQKITRMSIMEVIS